MRLLGVSQKAAAGDLVRGLLMGVARGYRGEGRTLFFPVLGAGVGLVEEECEALCLGC